MNVTPLDLPEVLLVDPDVHRDRRGFLFESWHAKKYADVGIDASFVQDNHSRSTRGTLRGLHLQRSNPQGKLVRVSQGEIFDVAIDVRHGSPRFGRFASVVLSAENFRQLWIPEGFAHGFCVLSDSADMQYKCTRLYDPTDDLTIAWDDPEIGIPWPVADPVLSDNDRRGRLLGDCGPDSLPRYPG